MHVWEEIKKPLIIAKSDSNVSIDSFKKLLENSLSFIINKNKVHNIAALYNSKPDVIKEVYAGLLRACAEFARNNYSRDNVYQFLTNECSYGTPKASIFADLYEEHRVRLQIQLGNIGTHLPHIVDVKWKIDYIIKSSSMDQTDGPIFRVALFSEVYDKETDKKKIEEIKFSCTSQELQALVYKLKDAERHCQRISSDH